MFGEEDLEAAGRATRTSDGRGTQRGGRTADPGYNRAASGRSHGGKGPRGGQPAFEPFFFLLLL